MTKNWNPNKGSCPVPEGTLVDVIHRNGGAFKRNEALSEKHCATIRNWVLEDCEADIIFWRLSKPKKEKAQ